MTSPQGETYVTFIKDILDHEYEQRRTIEARGAAIVTTSASLLTIIFGISVLFTGKDYRFASHNAVALLIISLIAFVLGAVLGIWVQNFQVADRRISRDSLTAMLDEHWTDDEVDARNICAYTNVHVIGSLRSGTALKSRVATIGLFMQVSAVLLLLGALGVELAARHH